MIKIVVKTTQASLKKRKLDIIGEDHEEGEGLEEIRIFGYREKKELIVVGEVQATINQMMKKGYKEEVDAQVA